MASLSDFFRICFTLFGYPDIMLSKLNWYKPYTSWKMTSSFLNNFMLIWIFMLDAYINDHYDVSMILILVSFLVYARRLNTQRH